VFARMQGLSRLCESFVRLRTSRLFRTGCLIFALCGPCCSCAGGQRLLRCLTQGIGARPAPKLRDSPAAGGHRHSHHAGASGSPRCEHDNDSTRTF
jgi:hypothetical protein